MRHTRLAAAQHGAALAVAAAAALAAASAAAQTPLPPAAGAPASTPDLPPDLPPELPDALNLQIDNKPGAAAEAPRASPLRVAFELGGGRVDLRGSGSEWGRIGSVDLRYSTALSPTLGFTLSDRYDHASPALPGQGRSNNSLRELFVAWQQPGDTLSVDAGRINYRQGPAYGYNPTDYFRGGALRTISTADPVALRERRLGTVMLRATQLLADGSVSLALAPKLDDGPDPRGAALDLGATNNRHRALLTAGWRAGASLNGQAMALHEKGEGARFGANFTALASDALVVFGEFSAGKMRSIFEQVLPAGRPEHWRGQAALGLTYTLPTQLALTVEADYNSAGLSERQFQSVLAQGPAAYARYFTLTQYSQELGSRHAWLVYASQKNLFLKQLELTAFARINSVDDSRLLWAELRYRWQRVDGVLQWQRSQGRAGSEFGVLPVRESLLLSAAFYW